MLKTQKWLHEQGGDLAKLKDQLGINSVEHNDGRLILNYSHIDSPKTHPIVNECRALTLNKNDFSLIARSFPRFYNVGQNLKETKKFRWDAPVYAQDKEDGSLIKIFHWGGKWRIQTRGSFAEGKPYNECPYSWSDLVHKSVSKPSKLFSSENTHLTFICELCTPHNQVVRQYKDYNLFLLTCFFNYTELIPPATDSISEGCGLKRPKTHEFKDIGDAQAYVADMERSDPTFEGVVLQDVDNRRLKVKSSTWFSLSKIAENPNSLKHIVPHILAGTDDDLVGFFPHTENKVNRVKEEISKKRKEVDNLWYCYSDEDSKKKFALAVKHHPWSSLLFSAYEKGGHPFDYLTKEFLVKCLQNI